MSRYAHIPEIKSGVAFSDPWYKDDVWCQYRNAFTDSNWFLKLDSHLDSNSLYSALNLEMTLGRATVVQSVRTEETPEGVYVFCPMRYNVAQKELGIDTAKVFCGSLDDFNTFGESISFHTGSDGLFGDLYVFTTVGEDRPAGFKLFCSFDPEFMTEDQFFSHIISSFGGIEISEKEYLQGISPNKLENKVLLADEISVFSKAEGKSGSREKNVDSPDR